MSRQQECLSSDIRRKHGTEPLPHHMEAHVLTISVPGSSCEHRNMCMARVTSQQLVEVESYRFYGLIYETNLSVTNTAGCMSCNMMSLDLLHDRTSWTWRVTICRNIEKGVMNNDHLRHTSTWWVQSCSACCHICPAKQMFLTSSKPGTVLSFRALLNTSSCRA